MYNKYNNQKTFIDGAAFDSKKEAKRFCELKLLEKAGQISDLKLQQSFELIPSCKGERAIRYVSDFTYIENGEMVVEDVKGFVNDVYKIKRKLFKYKYPDLIFRETH